MNIAGIEVFEGLEHAVHCSDIHYMYNRPAAEELLDSIRPYEFLDA
jgi:hypothetical protein